MKSLNLNTGQIIELSADQVAARRSEEELWTLEQTLRDSKEVRQKRNILLFESDWTQLTDAPLDQFAWARYRQALRDVTAQEGFPHSVLWPVKP